MADLQEAVKAAIEAVAIAEANRRQAMAEYEAASATLKRSEAAAVKAGSALRQIIDQVVESLQPEEDSDG